MSSLSVHEIPTGGAKGYLFQGTTVHISFCQCHPWNTNNFVCLKRNFNKSDLYQNLLDNQIFLIGLVTERKLLLGIRLLYFVSQEVPCSCECMDLS